MNQSTETPRRRSLLGIFIVTALVLFGGLAILAAAVVAVGGGGELAGRAKHDRVAVVYVSGLITAEDTAGGLLPGSGVTAGAESIVDEIRAVTEDDTVKAVVVRINSPGGQAAASQEIFQTIFESRETKPFVASLADVAASGGYYIAAGCDQIVANPATMTASIGVIMSGYDFSGLMEWARVRSQTVKSGSHKDIMSFERSLTAEERRLLQDMVNDVYHQFLDDVCLGREMDPKYLRPLADGRVMTGRQAHKAKLVDELGGFWDAVDLAKELGGMPADADPGIEGYGRKGLLEQLLGVRTPARPALPAAAGQSGLVTLPGGLSPLWLLARLPGLGAPGGL